MKNIKLLIDGKEQGMIDLKELCKLKKEYRALAADRLKELDFNDAVLYCWISDREDGTTEKANFTIQPFTQEEIERLTKGSSSNDYIGVIYGRWLKSYPSLSENIRACQS